MFSQSFHISTHITRLLSSAQTSNQCISGTNSLIIYEKPSQMSLSISGIPHWYTPRCTQLLGQVVGEFQLTSTWHLRKYMCKYLSIKLTHMIKLSGWHVPWKVSVKCDRAKHWSNEVPPDLRIECALYGYVACGPTTICPTWPAVWCECNHFRFTGSAWLFEVIVRADKSHNVDCFIRYVSCICGEYLVSDG